MGDEIATQTAGYSGTPLAKKLGIKAGFHIKLVNAPENYFDLFTDLPGNLIFIDDDVMALYGYPGLKKLRKL